MTERLLLTLSCAQCGRSFYHLRGSGGGGTPITCSEECQARRRRDRENAGRRRRAAELRQGAQTHRRRVDTPPEPAARDGHAHEWERQRYRTSAGVPWQRHRCIICGDMRLLEWAGSEEYQAEQAHHVGRLAVS